MSENKIAFLDRISVSTELILIISLVFLFVLSGSGFYSTWVQKEHMLEIATEKADDAGGFYFDGLNTLMLAGEIDQRDILKTKLLKNPLILEARVIRSNLLNESVEDEGKTDEKAVDALDQRALAGEKIIEISEQQNNSGNHRVVTVISPFKALKNNRGVNCLNCHQVPEGSVLGAIRISYSLERYDSYVESDIINSVLLNTFMLLLGLAAFYMLIKRRLITPLAEVGMVAKKIAHGDFNFVAETKRSDELGHLMMDMEHMRDSLQKSVSEREETTRKEHAELEKKLEMQESESALIRNFESEIAETVTSVDNSARGVGDMASQLSDHAGKLINQSKEASDGASQGSQHVESTAAASEEISVTISDISKQVSEALRISEQAVNQASATNETLESLNAASEEIDSVVRLIGEIAEQTNLLALNASIEAARAGDAGRGFAVVAGEVKELANQTASATESISTQIANLQRESQAASTAITEIGKSIHDVNKVNQDIAEAMNQQTQASREISEGAQLAANGMATVSKEIHDVSQVADETSLISSQLLEASTSLTKVIEQQQDIVSSFLDDMQQARSK